MNDPNQRVVFLTDASRGDIDRIYKKHRSQNQGHLPNNDYRLMNVPAQFIEYTGGQYRTLD